MPWEDFGWADLPSHETPLTAANLEAFGQHIYDLIIEGGGGAAPDFITLTMTDTTFANGETVIYDEAHTEFDPGVLS